MYGYSQAVRHRILIPAFAGSNPASRVLLIGEPQSDKTLSVNGILAQLVEHLTFNQVVGGSNPPCLSRNVVNSRVTGISNEYGTQKSTQSTQKTVNYQQILRKEKPVIVVKSKKRTPGSRGSFLIKIMKHKHMKRICR